MNETVFRCSVVTQNPVECSRAGNWLGERRDVINLTMQEELTRVLRHKKTPSPPTHTHSFIVHCKHKL